MPLVSLYEENSHFLKQAEAAAAMEISQSKRENSKMANSIISGDVTVINNGTSSIDILPDDILLSILSRLGSFKTADGCKIVSKRWNRIISHPYYKVCFRRHVSQVKQNL